MTLMVGFVVFNYTQKVLSDELASRLDTENQFAKHQIESLFEDTSSYVKQMTFNPKIKSFLTQVDTLEEAQEHPNFRDVVNALNAIEKSNDQIFLVWVANETANFYVDDTGYVSGPEYDVFIRPWHKDALKNNVINYTDPYLEWETKQYVISSIATLTEPDGSHFFCVVDFDLRTIPDVVNQINVGSKGEVMIVADDGTFIYHHNPEYVLNQQIQNIYPDIYDWTLEPHDGMEVINHEDQDYFILSQAINYSNWHLITIVNKKEVESGLNRFMMYLIGLIVLIGAIVTITIVFIIKNRLKPIDALSVYGEQIANGKFESSPPYEYAQLNDEMGKMARSFVTITEVFEQKNKTLEEIVSSQYEEIKQQYQYIIDKEKIASLGVLVAGVAHEINTPLGNGVTSSSYIQNEVKRMKDLFESNKLSKSEFDKILNSLTDASSLLMNNLDRASELVKQFKSIAINQNIESLKSIELKEEIDKILTSLKPTTRKNNLEILNEVDSTIFMVTYPGAISQVITNFIMNSMHHGYGDQEKGTIIIRAVQDGQLVRLTYLDDGKGIPPEILAHVFEPFYTTRRNKDNSGLGMYIIHNLVNQTLSGTIACESKVGEGVRFDLTLPLELKK